MSNSGKGAGELAKSTEFAPARDVRSSSDFFIEFALFRESWVFNQREK